MDNCLFCRIIAGEIPSPLMHDGEHVVAFSDINPQAPLHALIVPRRHIRTLNDLPAAACTGRQDKCPVVPGLVRPALAGLARLAPRADQRRQLRQAPDDGHSAGRRRHV